MNSYKDRGGCYSMPRPIIVFFFFAKFDNIFLL